MRSVQTPEALAALRKWVAAYEQVTRDRGEAHFKAGHVITPPTAKADHYVEAVVRDENENHQSRTEPLLGAPLPRHARLS